MALNFSHRPFFPAHLSEDPMRIASGYLLDSIPEKNGDGFGRPWHSSLDAEDCFEYNRDRCDRSATQECVSTDILDLLPSDPFGMDRSTRFSAITGLFKDLKVEYPQCIMGYGRDEIGRWDGSYQSFPGLNFTWNSAMRFQAHPPYMELDNKCNPPREFCGGSEQVGDTSINDKLESSCYLDEFLGDPNDVRIDGETTEECQDFDMLSEGDDEAGPHPALQFALSYLGLRDLLLVETVCKSLHLAVRGDPLFWRNIHIDQPLNEKITDDALLELTNRAHGNLQCLTLVECPRITDDGLRHVLENNPKLTKLCVPSCTRISIETIVNGLKVLKSNGTQGVTHLRIGGFYGVTQQHFEELKSLLGTDSHKLEDARKPLFYHRGNIYLSCDDDRAIDIEMCPRCENLRLVYDCPVENCKGKEHPSQECRACTLCIARCAQCGCCINDNEYEETFCLELLCSGCWEQTPSYQESHDRSIGSPQSAVPNLQRENSFYVQG